MPCLWQGISYVSLNSRVLGLCGSENALSDDTPRHVVSSKTRISGLYGLEKPQGDDTLRRIVSSKTRILRPNSLKLQNLMIPRDEDMLCS